LGGKIEDVKAMMELNNAVQRQSREASDRTHVSNYRVSEIISIRPRSRVTIDLANYFITTMLASTKLRYKL
jgi:hypothetical protein